MIKTLKKPVFNPYAGWTEKQFAAKEKELENKAFMIGYRGRHLNGLFEIIAERVRMNQFRSDK